MTTPPPLTTPDIDVRDLDGFMLNSERLLASELWALSTGEEFKAAMGLWCRAWKQIPAGSLPNDERVLASFACIHIKRWPKVRDVAMRGFVLCSDDRWYHTVLCAEAVRGHGWKTAKRAERDGETERKRREREDRSRLFAEARARGHMPDWNASTKELRALLSAAPVTRTSPGQDPGHPPDRTPPVTPDVTVLTGQDRTGQDIQGENTSARAEAGTADRWPYERSQPWAATLRAASCKIGAQNWPAWRALCVREGDGDPTDGVRRVAEIGMTVPATERWPDRVEEALAKARDQAPVAAAVEHKIRKITL